MKSKFLLLAIVASSFMAGCTDDDGENIATNNTQIALLRNDPEHVISAGTVAVARAWVVTHPASISASATSTISGALRRQTLPPLPRPRSR